MFVDIVITPSGGGAFPVRRAKVTPSRYSTVRSRPSRLR